MARRRFFVPEIRRGSAELTGVDAEHLVRVLRAEPGQMYELSDNSAVYLAEIETARKSSVTFKVLERLATPPSSPELLLLPALFKFDRFEWMLEKATELGVSTIQPVEAIRSERGLANASVKRTARWERIVLEASQQSRRARLPRIEPVVRSVKSVEVDASRRLLLDETQSAPPILSVLSNSQEAIRAVAILLGPEGGWTGEELREAESAGWQRCSLGPTVLRAETAAIAALAVLQSWFAGSVPRLREEQKRPEPDESRPENW